MKRDNTENGEIVEKLMNVQLSSKVMKLLETFASHIETCHSQQYNETQLRREFMNSFVIELGWDVTNKAGYTQAYDANRIMILGWFYAGRIILFLLSSLGPLFSF